MGRIIIAFNGGLTDGQTIALACDKESYLAIIHALECEVRTITISTPDEGMFTIPCDRIKFVNYKEK